MANTITLQTTSYDGRYLQLVCSQQTNIEGNYSTITWVLSSVGGSVNYYDTGPTTVKINNEQVYYKARTAWSSYAFPAKKGSVSGSYTVYHDDEGKASIPVFLETAIYNSTKRTVNKTWELDTIPRGAKVLTVPSDFTDSETPLITYSNPLGDSVDKLEACITTADGITILVPYREISKTADSYFFELNDGEYDYLMDYMWNTHYLDIRFYIRTTINGKQFLHSLPSGINIVNANPEIDAINIADIDERTLAITGDGDILIKGHNTVSIEIKPWIKKDARFVSCEVLCGNQSVEAQMESDGYCRATLQDVEDGEFNIIITDSRGYYLDTYWNLQLVDYVDITCSQEVSIELVGEEEANVHLTVKGNYYNSDFENSDNDYFFYYRYSENGGQYTDWIEFEYAATEFYDDGTYMDQATIYGLNYDSTYTIQCKAADMLTEDITTEYTVKLVPVFDWGENDFNFNVPVSFQGYTMVDMPIEEGTEAMGTNGTWYWRKWKSGKAECWGTRNYGNMGVSSQFGYSYTSSNLSQSLPSGLFTAAPDYLSITVVKGGNGALVTGGVGTDISKSSTGIFRVSSAASGTLSQVHLSFYAIGRWK